MGRGYLARMLSEAGSDGDDALISPLSRELTATK